VACARMREEYYFRCFATPSREVCQDSRLKRVEGVREVCQESAVCGAACSYVCGRAVCVGGGTGKSPPPPQKCRGVVEFN